MEGLEEQYPLRCGHAPYQNADRQEENEEENDGIADDITRLHAKGSSRLLVPCDVESPNCSEIPAFVLRYLYVGHFTARWGTRMWEFSVGLFMINVWPASLLLAAIYGVVETASVAILGTNIGDWIDRTPYIKVLRAWLGLQNLSFIVAGAAVVALLIYPAGSATFGGRMLFIGLVVLINACGAVGALASLAGSILVERQCFGTLMIANLEWKGIPTYVLGLARGLAAIVGIFATLIYPKLHSCLQLLYIGLWAIWFQWCSLLLCVASIWIHKEQLSAWLLVAGVVVSRLGLWIFDLSVLQQMQDSILAENRGVVAGVQNSLQSFMDLMTYVMGIIISNPQDFKLLILISFMSVTCALILYMIHTYQIILKK